METIVKFSGTCIIQWRQSRSTGIAFIAKFGMREVKKKRKKRGEEEQLRIFYTPGNRQATYLNKTPMKFEQHNIYKHRPVNLVT